MTGGEADPGPVLPAHLAERIHRVRAPGVPGPGAEGEAAHPFVLYWMRTAVRGHENPALDVALHLSADRGVPLFVYHALSERYPWASDRHHRFILDGAVDVAGELAGRRIGYAFHLERPGHRGPHLVELARRAAAVVTEDMPVRPLTDWTEALARRSGQDVVTVDTACLVPMRSVAEGATDRAYRFRKATAARREATLPRPWPEQPDPERAFVPPDLPFEPVDLDTADPAELVASCCIDHAVGPVPHSPGGSRAGYARWAAFRAEGLRSYAGARNNPLVPGVSRMSPYLHYGQVSPFRIAREAAEQGGRGAEKYLDELLVWRELAYAFCAHHPRHDTLAILPDWARATLAAHVGDPREILSWETLARGRTGDLLWDAAQRSLLGHGELHNNVRMTWGKALLGWSRDAAQALDRMVDLNHRYALDGRDPASFGGILWCLGVFDRPFTPERPVLGRVRSRSTEAHARRLDVESYRRRVEAPAWRDAPAVAVIGAGVAGLMAARTLADHGLTVTVFDKGRRPGGRANTREHGERRFDHGAPFFTISDSRLATWLRSWLDDGIVAPWDGRLPPGGGRPGEDSMGGGGEGAASGPLYVGAPGMIALPAHLARDLDVRSGVRVESLDGTADPWHVGLSDGGRAGPFGAVVIAVPPAQAVPLLAAAPELQGRVAQRELSPCWATLVAFAEPLELSFDAVEDAGPLARACREGSKPGRPSDGDEAWVLQASAEWSREHLEDDPDAVARALLQAFEGRVGSLPEVRFLRAHRWRYARAGAPADPKAFLDPRRRLAVCGDGIAGGGVEGALLSGIAAAGLLLGTAQPAPENPLGDGRPVGTGQLALEL